MTRYRTVPILLHMEKKQIWKLQKPMPEGGLIFAKPDPDEFCSSERHSYIYLLLEPLTGEIRYVGQCVTPSDRYRNHCRSKDKTPVALWCSELASQGMKPVMCVVAKISATSGCWWIDERIINGAERKLITVLSKGGRLLNVKRIS